MDEINIKGIEVFAYHGVLKEEKEKGQKFILDIGLGSDLRSAGVSDDLSKTVDYAELTLFAKKVFSEHKFDLIEAAAEKTAEEILLNYDLINAISVTVHKPEAPIETEFNDVSVTVKRSWHTAYISTGSNIGDGVKTLDQARDRLVSDKRNRLIKEAKYITTKAYGKTDQPDFTNGLIKIKTLLYPEELLNELNRIEAELGRERIEHWGPRTVDMDIIYYDDLIIDTKKLTIPHYDMRNREFVLLPLLEVDPYVRDPRDHKLPKEMLDELRN